MQKRDHSQRVLEVLLLPRVQKNRGKMNISGPGQNNLYAVEIKLNFF